VKAVVKNGDDVTLSVRLLQKATRKPVTDGEVTKARINMSGMAGMGSPMTAGPPASRGFMHAPRFDGRALGHAGFLAVAGFGANGTNTNIDKR
jgi:hypothetical protein